MSNARRAARRGFALLLLVLGRTALAAGAAGAAGAAEPVEPGPADEAYALHFIGFDDFGGVVSDRGHPVGTLTWSQPYEGKYKVPLEGERFYEKLGRLDLARAYRSREASRVGLQVAGVVLAVAATGLAVGAAVSRGGDPGRAPDVGLTVGAVASVLTSCAAFGIASSIDPNPIEAPEARRLAEEYNRALKARLSPPPEPRDGGLEVRVSPALLRGGGGVQVAVRF